MGACAHAAAGRRRPRTASMITPMLVQAYGAAFAIIIGSVVLGRAICALCGGPERWWAAPLVGFSSLIIIASVAIKLPGRAVTATVVCAAVLVAAAAYLLVRTRPRIPWGDLVVGGASLLGASIPFVAEGRVGIPGPPLDNDMAVHLLIAEALRSASLAKIYRIPPGYPLGAHSLVATLGTALDIPLGMVFTGLLVATVCLTALVAAGVVGKEVLWRRTVVGVLCSLTYLVAAYYGEGSFKETIMAGLLLAFVLHLEQVRARWSEAGAARRTLLVLPAGLLGAGAIYSYAYLGASWFAAALGVWLVFEVASRPALVPGWLSWRRARAAAPWAIGVAVLGIIVLIPIAGLLKNAFQIVGVSPTSTADFATTDLGNLPGPLSPFEALGLWSYHNFFYSGSSPVREGIEVALAIAVALFGFVWSLRRRWLVLPAAVAGAWLITLYTDETQSPYLTAKALVISAPLTMALGLRALLTRQERSFSTNAVMLAIAAVFCGVAAASSYLTLQTEPVQAPEPGSELAAFHRRIGDAPVLFLGIDDFAPWQLRGSPVYAVASADAVSVPGLATTVTKPFDGMAMDFDSMAPAALDQVRYVVTTNTPYASQAPSNFHLLERRKLYELWERKGPTPPFLLFEPPGVPGAIFDCHTPFGRKLSSERGFAALMVQPVTGPGVTLGAGQTGTMSLKLPPGRWEISAEYLSPFELDFSSEDRHFTMPAYLGRNGPWFAVGDVTGHGAESPVTVTATAQRPSPLTGSSPTSVSIYGLAATAVPDTRGIVPLRYACGKYVDWYELR